MRNKKTAIECCWPPKSSIWGKAAYNEDFLTRNLLVKIVINNRHLMSLSSSFNLVEVQAAGPIL